MLQAKDMESSVRLIGYATARNEGPQLAAQVAELRQAQCTEILEEIVADEFSALPILSGALRRLAAGDTLVMTQVAGKTWVEDRLPQILGHLERIGANFRSIGEAIDTAHAPGRTALLGVLAATRFERAMSGIRAIVPKAAGAGAIGMAPGPKPAWFEAEGQAERQREIASADAGILPLDGWLVEVRQRRPRQNWKEVLAAVNSSGSAGTRPWTMSHLKRIVAVAVRTGVLPAGVLGRVQRDRSA